MAIATSVHTLGDTPTRLTPSTYESIQVYTNGKTLAIGRNDSTSTAPSDNHFVTLGDPSTSIIVFDEGQVWARRDRAKPEDVRVTVWEVT